MALHDEACKFGAGVRLVEVASEVGNWTHVGSFLQLRGIVDAFVVYHLGRHLVSTLDLSSIVSTTCNGLEKAYQCQCGIRSLCAYDHLVQNKLVFYDRGSISRLVV